MAHHWCSPHWNADDAAEIQKKILSVEDSKRLYEEFDENREQAMSGLMYIITLQEPAMMARKVWEAYEDGGAIIAGPSKIPWAFKVSSVFVFTLELHSEQILSFSDLFA